MAEFVQMTIDGLVMGNTLALFVLGFSLLMGVVGIINMAHAAFYGASGIAIWYLSQIMDFNYALAVVITIVGMGLIGIIVERLLYRPFRKDLMAGIVIAMGFMFFAQGAVSNIMREAGYNLTPRRVPSIISGQVHFLGADISKERILIIGVSLLAISGLILFLNRTKMGWAVRATSMDAEASVLQGIHVGTISMIVMMVACMLVALAAGLMAPVYGADPAGGFDWLMKGMIAIALGGLGSIGGTLSACVILGLVESYATTKIGGNEAMLILFAILALILLVRPTGLAGKKIMEEMV